MPASAPQGLRERPAQRGGAHAPPRHATAGAPRARRPEDHRPALRPRIMRAVAPPRPRVLLTTEGTYPYAVGGVSSWCDLLVKNLHEFDWQVLPIVAPGKREPLYTLPPQAREVEREVGLERRDRERDDAAQLLAEFVGSHGIHHLGRTRFQFGSTCLRISASSSRFR